MKKRPINEMKITFPSLSENERFARIAVSGFLSQLDPALDQIADIKTAVSEAVTNAIVHGYRGTVGAVTLQVRIFDERNIYIKIQDKGCGIEDIEKAMEPLFTTAPEEDRAGLGFAVMESFMDKITVRSAKGRGTSVILRKQISSRRNLDE